MAKKTPAKESESKPKSKRGGFRPGAGAKPKAVKEFRDGLIVDLITAPPPPGSNAPAAGPGPIGPGMTPAPVVGGSAAERAIRTIEQLMDDTEAPRPVRLAAAREILDRVIGKPRQAVEVSGKDGESAPQVIVYIPDNGRDSAEQES